MGDDTRPVKPVSRRLRFEILRRDNYTCRYCGASAPDAPLTVDHVIPRALGGDDEPTNLVTACQDCNSGKGSTSPDEATVADVEEKALQWAKAIERAAVIRRGELDDEATIIDAFYNEWREYFRSDEGLFRSGDWEASIRRFLARGLTLDDLKRFIYATAVSSASWSQSFRYFCGCCWREISDREELARRLIEDGEA